MQNNFYPGRTGLIPKDLQALRSKRRAERKVKNRARRKIQQANALIQAYWWGFSSNRAARRAYMSKRLAGPYSRVVLQDAYGEDIDRNNPADMEFATQTYRPATDSHGKFIKPPEMSDLMVGLLVKGEFDGWDTRTA